MHLVGYLYEAYHDARSLEHKDAVYSLQPPFVPASQELSALQTLAHDKFACHQGMALPQVTGGGDDLHIWSTESLTHLRPGLNLTVPGGWGSQNF